MRTWFQRYRFTHPITEDFLHTIEEAAVRHGKATPLAYTPAGSVLPRAVAEGQAGGLPQALRPFTAPAQGMTFTATTLRPFFDQAVYGTAVLDYAVDSIDSEPIQWWLPSEKPKSAPTYQDTVVLRRRGDFTLPVTVQVTFEDGTRLREQWGGVERWHRFTYTKATKIISAEVDPDHTVLLDKNFFNNSMTTRPNSLPTHKVATLWVSILQFISQCITWIV